jgi:hypothetical protein
MLTVGRLWPLAVNEHRVPLGNRRSTLRENPAPSTKFLAMLLVLPMVTGPPGPGTLTAPKLVKLALKSTFALALTFNPGLLTVTGEPVEFVA